MVNVIEEDYKKVLCSAIEEKIGFIALELQSVMEKFSLQIGNNKVELIDEYLNETRLDILQNINKILLNETIDVGPRKVVEPYEHTLLNTLELKNNEAEEVNNANHDEQSGFNKIMLKRFTKIEKVLCVELGLNPVSTSYEAMSSNQLTEFRDYLSKLRALKRKRQQFYHKTISEIKELLKKLEIFSWSNEEKYMLNNEHFLLTKENLNSLHSWHSQLQQQFNKEKEMVNSLKEKITFAWNKLRVAESVKEQFWINLSDRECGKHTLSELQKELKRCQQILNAEVKNEIFNLRKEILTLWKECNTSSEERNRFTAFNSKTFNEKLLDDHKAEVNKLKRVYKNNELEILADKWHKLLNELVIFDNKNKNPQRSCKQNHRPVVEDKQRRILCENIAIVESNLLEKLQHYEIKYSKDFYYKGNSLLAEINQHHRLVDKENEHSKKSQNHKTSDAEK